MRVYLSGPMTGYPEHNFPLSALVRSQLRDEGFEVLCPAEAGVVEGWSWEQYLRRDLRMVLDADAVIVLPGWEESRGAVLETDVARQLAMPIVPLSARRTLQETPS